MAKSVKAPVGKKSAGVAAPSKKSKGSDDEAPKSLLDQFKAVAEKCDSAVMDQTYESATARGWKPPLDTYSVKIIPGSRIVEVEEKDDEGDPTGDVYPLLFLQVEITGSAENERTIGKQFGVPISLRVFTKRKGKDVDPFCPGFGTLKYLMGEAFGEEPESKEEAISKIDELVDSEWEMEISKNKEGYTNMEFGSLLSGEGGEAE